VRVGFSVLCSKCNSQSVITTVWYQPSFLNCHFKFIGYHKIFSTFLGWLAIVLIVVVEVGVGTVILCFGTYFVDFFTTDQSVRKLAKGSLTFLSAFCFVDAIQGVISGILRGAGKQAVGAIFNIIAFYVIGLPLAYFFCFKTSFGINGLMLGLAFGVIFQDIVCLYLITCCETFIFPKDADSFKSSNISVSQHGLISNDQNNSETVTVELGLEMNKIVPF
jgi:hypothetical protein